MHVFLIAALTADGFIAKDNDHLSTRWTSKEDTRFFIERTKQAGVIVNGSKTFETYNCPLPGRQIVVYTSKPEKLQHFDPAQVRATNLEPAALIAEIEQAGHDEVAICGGSSIYTLFMESGLVQTLYLTIEPVLFGQGMRLFAKPIKANLRLQETKKLSEQTIVQVYSVQQVGHAG